jgi:zinc transport system ATP-binding protein
MTEKILSVKNLSLFFNERKIFSNVSFEIEKKDKIAILGPNGSGKTSIIKILLGFQKQSSGIINHFGEKLYGYLPQYFHPIESMNLTVLDFLKFTKEISISINEAIKLTDISDLLKYDINSLSGGEIRKVLMAKTLLSGKEIIFLDEPTCWLDSKSQKKFYDLISNLQNKIDCAIVFITHDFNLNKDLFTKIINF